MSHLKLNLLTDFLRSILRFAATYDHSSLCGGLAYGKGFIREQALSPFPKGEELGSSTLKDGGNALPPPNAHGLEAIADLPALHLMHQAGHNAHARRPDGMAQRNT